VPEANGHVRGDCAPTPRSPPATWQVAAAVRRTAPDGLVANVTRLNRILEELTKVVPPPKKRPRTARAANDAAWNPIERDLGTALPRDYKELVALYGGGKFKQFLWLLSPFSANDSINLLQRSLQRAEHDREFREQIPEEFPYSIFPEPQGLLLCAKTDTGAPIYWVTTGPVNRWPLLVQAPREPRNTLSFDGTLSEFLLMVLGGALHVPFFPAGYEKVPPIFAAAPR
jgi:hypothetical protein